ncbi:alpha/beta hydrolase [Candidatus Microgenomates bacterium]|nr:alpha/beta hydrolase [Candidatus Microgenomates bacterium]
MKNAVFLVGTGETAKSFWWPYLEKALGYRGYSVSIPELPLSEKAVRDINLPIVMEKATFDKDTVIVGHSSGCPLALSVLENIDVKIKQLVLVAGFAINTSKDEELPILQDTYDWKRIKSNVEDVVIINSVNDPWGCDDKQGRYIFDNLGGTLIINNEGHMGSDSFNQPYEEFPLLIKLIDGENWGK